jgi:hypothetical protein
MNRLTSEIVRSAETWTCLTLFKRNYSQWQNSRVTSVEETLPNLCILKGWHCKVLGKKKLVIFQGTLNVRSSVTYIS